MRVQPPAQPGALPAIQFSPLDEEGDPKFLFGFAVLRKARPDDLQEKESAYSTQRNSHSASSRNINSTPNSTYQCKLFQRRSDGSIHSDYYIRTHKLLRENPEGYLCLHPSGEPIIIKKISIPSEKGIVDTLAFINPNEDHPDIEVYTPGSKEFYLYTAGHYVHKPANRTYLLFNPYGVGESTGHTATVEDYADALIAVLKQVGQPKNDGKLHLTGHSAAVMAIRKIAKLKIATKNKETTAADSEQAASEKFLLDLEVDSITLTGSPENLSLVARSKMPSGLQKILGGAARQLGRCALGASWIDDRHEESTVLFHQAFDENDQKRCKVTSKTIEGDEVISPGIAFKGDTNITLDACPKEQQAHANYGLFDNANRLTPTRLFDNRRDDDITAHLIGKYKGACPPLEAVLQNYEKDKITLDLVIKIIRTSIHRKKNKTTIMEACSV